MPLINIKTREQAAEVAALAAEIWTEYYAELLGPEQVEYMITNIQSAEAIWDAVQNLGYRYYLSVAEGEKRGYCGVLPEGDRLFLSKLYVRRECRGQGVGRELLDAALAEVPQTRVIWLTVNKGNEATIATYLHMGFRIIREQAPDIGAGYVMDDYVMEKTL